MVKNNRGVSLLSLVVTIAIMIVILSITISSSIKSVDEANITKIQNEIKNLEDAVNDRIINYERNSTLYPIVGKRIGDGLFDEYIRTIKTLEYDEINEIIVSYSADNANYYRLVGRNEAEKLGVESIDVEHYYVVDYIECEVYGPVSIEIVEP